MKKNIFTLILLVTTISSCYKEKPLASELGKPKYIIEDSEDPARHYVYNLWKDTGTFILEKYDSLDYKWNVSSLSNNIITLIPEEEINEVYSPSIDFLRATLLDYYNVEFIKKYFPTRIFLAQKIDDDRYDMDIWNDQTCQHGRAYLALGRLRKDAFPKTAEETLYVKGKINAMLWADFIVENHIFTIPEVFFTPCEDYYGKSMSADKEHRDDPEYIKKMGFWQYDEKNISNQWILPTRSEDIADFIEMIVTHSEEQMKEILKGYETLTVKYNIILSSIKEGTGVDLQAIGDHK